MVSWGWRRADWKLYSKTCTTTTTLKEATSFSVDSILMKLRDMNILHSSIDSLAAACIGQNNVPTSHTFGTYIAIDDGAAPWIMIYNTVFRYR
jgi:hypothetical protein